jgi:hypothetical protein
MVPSPGPRGQELLPPVLIVRYPWITVEMFSRSAGTCARNTCAGDIGTSAPFNLGETFLGLLS